MRLVAFSLAILVSCRSAAPVLEVPYASRTPASSTPASQQTFETPFAEVADALGFVHLARSSLPPSYREARIADSFGGIGGVPIPMLRIVQGPNGYSGELILFRTVGPGLRVSSDKVCMPFRSEIDLCAARMGQSSIDWNAVGDTLEKLGIWSISERCEDLRWSFDRGDLLIQRLSSSRFEVYRCNAPESRTSTRIGRQADSILAYLYELASPYRRQFFRRD
jgi:hypothetical protein